MAPWRRHLVPRSPNDCADPSMMRRCAMNWGRGHTPKLGTCCSLGCDWAATRAVWWRRRRVPTKLIRELLAREGRDVAVTRGSTYENRANLAAGFFDQVIRKYEGTRLAARAQCRTARGHPGRVVEPRHHRGRTTSGSAKPGENCCGDRSCGELG